MIIDENVGLQRFVPQPFIKVNVDRIGLIIKLLILVQLNEVALTPLLEQIRFILDQLFDATILRVLQFVVFAIIYLV